ncbi:MAG: PKD domain-containing protein [Bacteroidetes bacterium]|nr:PKD domain-containing protein [Bacteroidota bacterium]
MVGFSTCNFPVTPNAYQQTCGGAEDATVAKLCINACGLPNNVASFVANPTTGCSNTPVSFSLTNTTCDTTNTTYLWTFNGSFQGTSNIHNPKDITWTNTGTYDVSVKIMSPCDTISVTQANYITITPCGITATAAGSSICPGVCATAISYGSGGTNPYTYSWSTGDTSQNINPCPVSTTTYTVTIKDTGGNTATSTVVVTVNPAVTVTTSATNINCNGGTGSASALGGSGTSPYAYNWSNGQTAQTATGLTTGNYTVTATDSKGCTATSTSAIISPPTLMGQFTKGTASCSSCGCKEWIIVTATGGTSPYNYSWSDGNTNRYKNHLCPGTYTINITDKNGCNAGVVLTAP